jgi:hypothetical protein
MAPKRSLSPDRLGLMPVKIPLKCVTAVVRPEFLTNPRELEPLQTTLRDQSGGFMVKMYGRSWIGGLLCGGSNRRSPVLYGGKAWAGTE